MAIDDAVMTSSIRSLVDETPTDVSTTKKQRSSKKKVLESPSAAADHEPDVPAKKRGRRKKAKAPEPALLTQPLPLGTMVLPQAAAIVYSLIVEQELDNLRDLLAARNISHSSLLRHLEVLQAYGLIDEDLVSRMHLFQPSSGSGGQGESVSLTREQVADASGGRGVKTVNAFDTLSSKFPEAVAAQESRHQGITLLQIEYVKSMAKREAKSATIAKGSSDNDQQLTLQLMKSADLVRVQAYLDGKSVDEVRLPPYSRNVKREGGVSKLSALQSLIEAAKAGVQLPIERVLNDFSLLPSESGDPRLEDWLTVSEVCDAVGSCLHIRSSGLGSSGIMFYEAARNVLMRSQRSKVEIQEEKETQDLTLQQIR